MVNSIQKNIIAGVTCLLVGSTAASASGFGVKLNSGWTAGMANAGSGVVDDPLASFINPAAMILNKCHHASGQVTGIFPSTKFKGRAVNRLSPLLPPFFNKSGTTRNAAQTAGVPSTAFVMKLNERIRLGLAITAPFGLGFKYGEKSITQFYVTQAKMQTININPTVAFRVNDIVTFGAGFQAQWNEVKFYRKAVLGALTVPPFPFPTVAVRGQSRVKVDNWAYGWTAGVLLQPNEFWNIGFSYRSKMSKDLSGHLKTLTQSPSAAAGRKNKFKANAKVHFPHIFTLSGSLKINPCWTLYMDVIRTFWDSTENLIVNFKGNGTRGRDVTRQNWKNSWFISGGFNYQMNEKWSFRSGFGYDKTPTRDNTRIPALPDTNKHWLAAGATYTTGKIATTLSYGHEFFKKGRIHLSDAAQKKGTLKGRVKKHIDLVSLQVNYRF